jgi:hypothetical protein
MKEQKCSICGKNLVNKEDGSITAGQSWIMIVDKCKTSKNKMKYLREQMGPYKINKQYYSCWECTFKNMRFKP